MARTAVRIIERPFLVTLFITLSRVSSRITRSNNCGEQSTSVKTDSFKVFASDVMQQQWNVWEISYQKAEEELVHKKAQDADDGITQMVDKEHVHYNCFVASSERPLVANKTYEKD